MTPAQQDSLFGMQLDEYRLEDLLGRGGMARVYRALDVRLKRYVAIKVIDTPFRSDAEYLKRFEREAQAIGRLEHRNVVRLYRYGDVVAGDAPAGDAPAGDAPAGEAPVHLLYMAMQYVQGATLADVLESYRRDGEFIPPEDALRITGEMCQALDYIHGQGIIHRDVKPSNILLSREGDNNSYHAVLTDFGLALLTQMGTRGETFGTPHYIAPEQALSSAKAVPQSDLYALGVIIYEMFTGRLPFTGHDAMEIALQHMREAPPLPRDVRVELSPEVEAVILKALAKQPEERYQTGQALYSALRQALRIHPLEEAARLTVPERVTLSTINVLPGAFARAEAAQVVPAAQNKGDAPQPDDAATLAPGDQNLPEGATSAPENTGPGIPSTIHVAGDRGAGGAARPAGLSAPDLPRRSHKGLWIGLGLLAALLLLFACLLAGFFAIRGLLNNAPHGLATQPAGVPILETATSAPEATPAATSSGPQTYTFQLSRCKDQACLVLKNTGSYPIPLNSLVLSSGQSKLTGSEWGINLLMPGDCVKAVKDESAYNQLPEGVTCNAISGNPLMREGPDRIWTNTITATLEDIAAGSCPKNAGRCTLNVTK